jgi:hypothetical protein
MARFAIFDAKRQDIGNASVNEGGERRSTFFV